MLLFINRQIEICGGDTVLFYTFNSQEERRNYGGSAFIEMQFCKLPVGTSIEKIVYVKNINHWKNDSLYINNESTFYLEYSNVFNCGTYNNLKCGTVDIYGINYYAPFLTDSIIEKLYKNKLTDYEILMEWLIKSKAYNGF